jgi:malonate-semialdehyde dehydrogenase (acetylating)/methylmalonate-semialdehyde dehydrogenase
MLQQAGRNFSREYKNYVGGKWVASQAKVWTEQICPLTQDVIGVVPETTEAEFNAVVQNSAEAFKTWKYVPVSQKVRYMLNF